MKYQREVLSNPDYKRRHSQIWYYPVTQGEGKDTHHVMSDGEFVQYKFHIALDPATYKSGANPSRDIVSTFLLKNSIDHKCGGADGNHYYMTPGGQHGKMFTVYTASDEEFYIVAKGMQELVKKYKLKGIPLAEIKAGGGNQQYEKVVPNTNDTLYYTVEMATPNAIYAAIRSQHPEWIVHDKPDSSGYTMMVINAYSKGNGQIGMGYGEYKSRSVRYKIAGQQAIYMGGNELGYLLREAVVEHYMGEGPIDFLF